MGITEEMLLEKFNGDRVAAAYYAKALVDVMEEDYLRLKKDFDPDGPYMKGLLKKINDDFEWDMVTPWWKKVLIKVGLTKK